MQTQMTDPLTELLNFVQAIMQPLMAFILSFGRALTSKDLRHRLRSSSLHSLQLAFCRSIG